MRLAVGSWGKVFFSGAVLACLLLVASSQIDCSLPNLESPDCADAREAVREFYSFHYANDITMTPDNLKLREKFLTTGLFRRLMGTHADKDYFTGSDTSPKAFKVAGCKPIDSDKAEIGVHLFWKPDEQTTIQKEANVEAINDGGRWLVNNVAIQ